MDASSFIERWRRKEKDCGIEAVKLMPIGGVLLPIEIGSCQGLNFEAQPQRLWEAWGVPSDWSNEDRVRLIRYLMIGFEGAGNPLCVDESNGSVWMLDHEDWFHTRQFMNSSVSQLAECLLARLGENFSDSFCNAVRKIDNAAMSEQTFWWYEAIMMAGE